MGEQAIAHNERVLNALDTAKTTREVCDTLRYWICEAWAEEEGYVLEYDERGLPKEPLFASLLAHGRAKDRGEYLSPQQVRHRLIALEREGLVQRVQILGRRPMLWARRG